MEFIGQKLCMGYSNKKKKCKHINDCKLCQLLFIDDNSNEIYGCGIGIPSFKCERDNPDFKPITKDCFFEIYKEIPVSMRKGMGLSDILELAKIEGLVENTNQVGSE